MCAGARKSSRSTNIGQRLPLQAADNILPPGAEGVFLRFKLRISVRGREQFISISKEVNKCSNFLKDQSAGAIYIQIYSAGRGRAQSLQGHFQLRRSPQDSFQPQASAYKHARRHMDHRHVFQRRTCSLWRLIQ